MDVLSERRRALMGGNGMVNGLYTLQASTRYVGVTGGNTVRLQGFITSGSYVIPLKRSVTIGQTASIKMTHVGTVGQTDVAFVFSDGTKYTASHTKGEIEADPSVSFDVADTEAGKTLVGLAFGSTSHNWSYSSSYTWTLIVDGRTVF